MNTVSIGGLHFSHFTLNQVLGKIEDQIASSNGSGKIISTVNSDILLMTHKDSKFRDWINDSWIITADGMPIIWISHLLGNPLPERVTGADLTFEICMQATRRGFIPYFLGAGPGVAERAKERIENLAPGLRVAGYYSPTSEELSCSESSKALVERINQSGANILLVALGAPKQESWIAQHKNELTVAVVIGVGASIDFLAGAIPRAPMWIRSLGFEWAYRLSREPRRLCKRYVKDLGILRVAWQEVYYVIRNNLKV